MLLEEYNFLGKNPKLSHKWSGPQIILSLKGTHNAEILMNNKRKVLVNIERLKPYLSQNLPQMIENSENEETSFTQSSPSATLFATTEPPHPIPAEQITDQVNKSGFPPLPTQHPPPVKRRRGQPPGPRPPTPPPQISKNDGGICTRSQTAKQRALNKDLNINSLKYNCLPCFENCINNRHSKSCLQKAVNFMEKGDIYTSQKAYHKHNPDLNFNEEGEEEEEEQNDLGLGGSSPILSLHHSFDADETLQDIQEVEDEFKEEEDFIDEQDIEEQEKEVNESFLSTLKEFHSINNTLNETILAQTTPERNEEEIRKVFTETNKLKE